jgi:hypothetical protein
MKFKHKGCLPSVNRYFFIFIHNYEQIIYNNDTTFQLDKMECNYYELIEMKKELLQLKYI